MFVYPLTPGLKAARLFFVLTSCSVFAHASELTINAQADPVGPQPTLTGKAPDVNAKIFLIVNPVQTPQQFWVQKMVTVDGKKNWIGSIHAGDPGTAHTGQQFIVKAVGDPAQTLHEGDVLGDFPSGKWVSQPVILTRK